MRRQPPPSPGGEVDLRALFEAVWRRRVPLVGAAMVAGLLTFGITFLVPRWYLSTAVILPPEDSDLMSNLSIAQRALSKFPAFGVLPDFYTPADIFKAELLSRTAQEEVARQFDLASVYRLKSPEKVLKELKNHYKVKLNQDGTITVQVEDRSPQRAADMANAFLTALDRYNVEKRNSQARRTREFLERRVVETDSLLRVSEQALRAYQERSHTVVPTGPTSSGDVQAASTLMAQQIALEVHLGVLRSYLREDNDQVIQARNELEQLNARIGALPGLQNELARLMRDQKIEEQLYLLLTAELEQARIREAMDTPTVQVLDPAVPPERQNRPKRMLLGIGAAIVTLAAGITWIALRKEPDSAPTA